MCCVARYGFGGFDLSILSQTEALTKNNCHKNEDFFKLEYVLMFCISEPGSTANPAMRK